MQALGLLGIELLRSSTLKEALLNEEKLLDSTVAALAECAASVGSEPASSTDRAAAIATCQELGSIRDSLFGRL